MSYADVLEQIQEFIVANGSNDITADVLRPILESILGQPNELIGDLGDSTVDGSTIVEMLNALKEDLEAVSGITIHTGTNTPLVSPPVTFLRGDFFAQIVASVSISFWQFNGLTWVPIKNWINDDLVETETTWSSAKIQEVINLQDVLISILPPTYAAGNVTIQANAVWRIGGVIYTNPANVVKAVANATAGMYRTDLLVANQTNSFDVIAGTESATVQLPPTTPVGTIAVTPIYVYGSTVDVPEPVVGDYVKKIEFAENYISSVSGDLNLSLDTETSNYRILDAIDSITGFDTTALFNSSNSYIGKEVRIINNSGSPFAVVHNSGASEVPIRFPSEVDLTLNNLEVLVLRLVKTDMLVAEFISVSKDSFSNGGGGETRLLLNKKFVQTFHLTTISTWKANFTLDTTDLQFNVGNGSTPNSVFFTQSEFTAIPDGYIIEEVQAYITYKLEGSYDGDLQIYIARSESNDGSTGNGVSNTVEIVNETLSMTPGSVNLKYVKNLTVNTHSLPTLAKSFLQIAIRDTSIADIYYNINFNIILKKV